MTTTNEKIRAKWIAVQAGIAGDHNCRISETMTASEYPTWCQHSDVSRVR